MFNLKPISKEAISEALQKAERYRLLNEPALAESICQDILEIEPDNHQAIVTKLLAITDQFGKYSSSHVNAARHLLHSMKNEYDKHYYAGIICEREGNAHIHRGLPGDHYAAFDWLTDAMEYYEKAEAIRPPGNDDAILRWNTCARQIMSHHLKPRVEHYVEPPLE
jgi:tetratricopeptide (TPR) repeat protein